MDQKDTCGKYIQTLTHFLKYQCDKHFEREDNDCFHGMEYALQAHGKNRVRTACSACKFPSYVCEYIKDRFVAEARNNPDVNNEMVNDAKKVVDETAKKFRLFMGHKCRVRCQQLGIEAIYKEMREDFIESDGNNVHGVLLMDFKMKFEPVSGRETTLEHYGKRGICWHGCQLTYFDYIYEYNDDGTVASKIL